MPDEQVPQETGPKETVRGGFDSPQFLELADKAFKNSQAIREGRAPSESTDAPTDAKSATDGSATAEAAKNGEATPAQPGEPAKADPFGPPAAGSKVTREHWAALEKKHKDEVATYVAKIAEIEKQLGSVVAVTEERDKLRSELRLLDIERDPQFQAEWQAKQKAVMTRLEAIAGSDAQKLAQIAKLPPSDQRQALIDEILKSKSPSAQATIGAALYDVFRLEADRSDLIEQSRLARQQEAEQHVQRSALEARMRQSAFDKVANSWREALGEEFDKLTLTEAQQQAQLYFKGDKRITYENLANFAMRGALFDKINAQLAATQEEVAALKAANAALRGSAPSVGSASSGDDAAASAEGEAPKFDRAGGMDIGDIIASQAGKAGLLRQQY